MAKIWALLALCAIIGTVHATQPGQFGGSIFIGGPWDLGDACTKMVDSVVSCGTEIQKVQFLPTLYWWDSGPLESDRVDPSCSGTDLSSYYCYNRFNATTVEHWCAVRADGSCPEITADQISSLRSKVEACMKDASSKGLQLGLNARVDDGRSLGGWRNTLNFSPTEKYGQYAYEEAIINPLADALAAAAAPGAPVEFVLQGEMGATVAFHPRDWIEVIGRVRDRITAAREANGNPGPVEIGLGINNSKATGSEFIGVVDGNEYLRLLKANFNSSRYPDLPGYRAAYEAADFLSVSAYVPMPTTSPEPCLFEGLLQRMDSELNLYNISIKALESSGTELRWGEFGVGGGTNNNGDAPAKTAAEAAYTPFFGIQGPYTCAKDPFDMCHPDTPNEVRDYRRKYYKAASDYLKSGGCEYTAPQTAYIWGTGSFDVLAIYPGDSSSEGSWSDPVVTQTIGCHNAEAQGRVGARGCENGAAAAAPGAEGV